MFYILWRFLRWYSITKMPYTNTLHLPRSRVRHTVSSKVRLTESQRKERSARSSKRRAEIEDAVQQWKAYTLTLATDLGRRFNKKPRYFLDLFFQGGVHLVTKQGKVNAHNAFLAMKAQELRNSRISFVCFERENWPNFEMQMVKPRPSQLCMPPSMQRSTRPWRKQSSMK